MRAAPGDRAFLLLRMLGKELFIRQVRTVRGDGSGLVQDRLGIGLEEEVEGIREEAFLRAEQDIRVCMHPAVQVVVVVMSIQ